MGHYRGKCISDLSGIETHMLQDMRKWDDFFFSSFLVLGTLWPERR